MFTLVFTGKKYRFMPLLFLEISHIRGLLCHVLCDKPENKIMRLFNNYFYTKHKVLVIIFSSIFPLI